MDEGRCTRSRGTTRSLEAALSSARQRTRDRAGALQIDTVNLREHVPYFLLDLARAARDALSPSRRRITRARRAEVDELALLVSPSQRVLAGPFVGLHLPATAFWGGHAARLAGAYEEEIAPHVERAIARSPRLVVDAGAAEGYYAVGLARRLPDAQIIAYEIDGEARRLCAEVARRNDVTNVRMRGRVTPRDLSRRLPADALVLCDVEGYELDLLHPEMVPGLLTAHLIVELHEFERPGVSQTMVERFTASHTIELVDARPRTGSRPQLAHLDEATAHRAMDEGRPSEPRMQWAVMTPRAGPSRAPGIHGTE